MTETSYRIARVVWTSATQISLFTPRKQRFGSVLWFLFCYPFSSAFFLPASLPGGFHGNSHCYFLESEIFCLVLGLAREWGSPAAKWQTWCRCRWPRRRFGKAGIWKASLFVPSKSFSISLLRDPNTVELGDYFGDGNSSISMVQLFFFAFLLKSCCCCFKYPDLSKLHQGVGKKGSSWKGWRRILWGSGTSKPSGHLYFSKCMGSTLTVQWEDYLLWVCENISSS